MTEFVEFKIGAVVHHKKWGCDVTIVGELRERNVTVEAPGEKYSRRAYNVVRHDGLMHATAGSVRWAALPRDLQPKNV